VLSFHAERAGAVGLPTVKWQPADIGNSKAPISSAQTALLRLTTLDC
jgi:hypothetical protein